MKKRELGHCGLFVSEIGLGCMSLPTNHTEAKYIVDAAIEQGISYFDTADLYDQGKNEEVVGYALKGVRDQVILATKVGNKWNNEGTNWTWDSSKSYITNQVKESLLRLQTDYIDLYQLHGGTMEDNLEEAIDAFEELKKDGLIRAYGISSIRPNVIKHFLQNSHAATVMMQYSMLDRRAEEWFETISLREASVVTRGSLAKGLLTDESMARASASDGYGTYSRAEIVEVLQQFQSSQKDLHAVATSFVLKHQEVSSVLAGASSVEQINNTIQAYERPVTDECLIDVLSLLKKDVYQEHRD
jgi:aryl-alcohol dehydrogenase-like predicted oxidoreductase